MGLSLAVARQISGLPARILYLYHARTAEAEIMSEKLSKFDAETVRSIVEHMNQDHVDALWLYIKAFTHVDSESIQDIHMTDIDTDGISLTYKMDGTKNKIRISFVQTIGKPLSDVSGARGALVAMAKRARQ